MKYINTIFVFFVFATVLSCKSRKTTDATDERRAFPVHQSSMEEDSPEEEYSDGAWCADVEYYNPNTGTRNTYVLEVEVEDGELVQINWPNGGWLDESHFIAEDISSGECSFTSDRGYEYTVTLNEKGGCSFTDGHRMRLDIERDVKQSICSRCGEEKESYENLCGDCKNKAQTCPKCYGMKFDWEKICSSCKDEMEEDAEDY